MHLNIHKDRKIKAFKRFCSLGSLKLFLLVFFTHLAGNISIGATIQNGTGKSEHTLG